MLLEHPAFRGTHGSGHHRKELFRRPSRRTCCARCDHGVGGRLRPAALHHAPRKAAELRRQPAAAGRPAAFDLGHVPQGDRHILWIQFQTNPTDVGRRPQNVRLYDGTQLLATIHREVTVFP